MKEILWNLLIYTFPKQAMKPKFGFIASLARNDGFNARDLREILTIATENRAFFVEKWNEYFA
jgi:hypothetical protein